MPRQSLEQFIRAQLTGTGIVREDKCIAFSLVHYQGSVPQEMPPLVKIGSRPIDPKELAEDFQQRIDNHAAGIRGEQQYAVLSFFHDTENIPQGKFPILAEGARPEVGGIGTEAPTEVGERQQRMRHTEVAMRMAFDMMSLAVSSLGGTNKLLSQENSQLRTENMEALELSKELLLRQAVDTHEMEMKRLAYERNSSVIARAVTAGPAIINRLAGREIIPRSAEDTAILESLAESMTEEQLRSLVNILNDEQKALLAPRMLEIIERNNKRKAEENERKQKIQEANGNGIETKH